MGSFEYPRVNSVIVHSDRASDSSVLSPVVEPKPLHHASTSSLRPIPPKESENKNAHAESEVVDPAAEESTLIPSQSSGDGSGSPPVPGDGSVAMWPGQRSRLAGSGSGAPRAVAAVVAQAVADPPPAAKETAAPWASASRHQDARRRSSVDDVVALDSLGPSSQSVSVTSNRPMATAAAEPRPAASASRPVFDDTDPW
jgi:hypothetical protein